MQTYFISFYDRKLFKSNQVCKEIKAVHYAWRIFDWVKLVILHNNLIKIENLENKNKTSKDS